MLACLNASVIESKQASSAAVEPVVQVSLLIFYHEVPSNRGVLDIGYKLIA